MAPINDNFEDAIVMTGERWLATGTNYDSTYQSDQSTDPFYGLYGDVWWSWTAPRTGRVTIDTLGSDFNTLVGVYTGSSVDNLTEISLVYGDINIGIRGDLPEPVSPPLASRFPLDVVAGTTYHIAVSGFADGPYSYMSGGIQLNLNYLQTGTANADRLNGSRYNDTIYGRGGNDAINGNGGYDYLYGEGGNDRINGGSLRDAIYGGTGNDVINGNGGRDLIYGEAGHDVITGGSSFDNLSGGDGDDILYGNGGERYVSDYIVSGEYLGGGNGNDRLYGSSSDLEHLFGGSGNDVLYGNGGLDDLHGEGGDDLIHGGSQRDVIYGGGGNDTIYGNGGDDFIISGTGVDVVYLGSGAAHVSIYTGNGFVTLHNFNADQTKLQLGWGGFSYDDLSFSNSAAGARISLGSDLLAVVRGTQASVFVNHPDIFVNY